MAGLNIIRGDADAPLDPLRDRVVGILGFGNQGAAHAMNLRDSGIEVLVANRPDTRNGRRAIEADFTPRTIREVVTQADVVIIALPDELQPEVFEKDIQPHLTAAHTIGFLHGFAIRYGLISPPTDAGVVMVAPKGPGATLRDRFARGMGIPCLMAVHQRGAAGDAEALALAWANGIGCARAGIIQTTFADETETDLFGEQAVLCGGMTWLMLAAFETLVEAGYPPELAYLECCHEVKQVADLVYERGVAAMMEAISNTAEYGAHVAGPRLVDDAVRQRMRSLLNDIRDGSFAQQLHDDYRNRFQWFNQQRSKIDSHPVDEAGAVIRRLTPTNPPRAESPAPHSTR